jgi:hypothetical protein
LFVPKELLARPASGPPSSGVFAAITIIRLPQTLGVVHPVVGDNPQQEIWFPLNCLHKLEKVGLCWWAAVVLL